MTTDMKLIVGSLTRQRKKIRSALRARWDVVPSVGHVCDLSAKEMGVDLQTFETFEPTNQLSERGAQV